MATTKKKARRTSPQGPRTRQQRPPRGRRNLAYIGTAAAIVVIGVAYSLSRDRHGGAGSVVSAGLPNTPDYHSLLVSPSDPDELFLGTHQGIYRSTDAGRHWASYALTGKDAMSLARPPGQTVWTAGHNVFAKSRDGGKSWQSFAPESLPSLDIHAFAVDPRNPTTLYAAIAGKGLFRSLDGSGTFAQVSGEVGGAVMSLAVKPTGEVLAGDMQRGLVASRNGGQSWRTVLDAAVLGLAVNPRDSQLILAAGGPGVFRSNDGGSHWSQQLALERGCGPIAWAPSDPRRAYAVGFDRILYRSSDGGTTWAPVG